MSTLCWVAMYRSLKGHAHLPSHSNTIIVLNTQFAWFYQSISATPPAKYHCYSTTKVSLLHYHQSIIATLPPKYHCYTTSKVFLLHRNCRTHTSFLNLSKYKVGLNESFFVGKTFLIWNNDGSMAVFAIYEYGNLQDKTNSKKFLRIKYIQWIHGIYYSIVKVVR